MVVLFQQYTEIYAFSQNFPLMGSVIGEFYWLFLWNFKEIKHQPFSMTQPYRKGLCKAVGIGNGNGKKVPTF